MQPPSFPFGQWGCRADTSSYSSCGGQYGGKAAFGPSNFNFKDLSMSRAPSDYFSLNPIRGSSPTASLAADLSQNFHIDQRYVTPPYRSEGSAYDHQSPITDSSTIIVLDESFCFNQWEGYDMQCLIGMGGRSRKYRKHDHAPTSLVFARSLQRVNGNFTATPQGTLRGDNPATSPVTYA